MIVFSKIFRNLVDYIFALTIHPDDNQLSDLDLLALYKAQHETSVVGILFRRYKHLVYGVCLKYLRDPDESKDAVMQIFEKLIVDLKKHNIDNFKAWLHTVSKNHCLMIIRKNKSRGYQSAAPVDESMDVVEMNALWHPDHNVEKENTLQRLEEAIQHLNNVQKRCIELFYLEEKSYQQVSELTGYSMLQVKSFIQNGKRNLKIMMEKKHAG